MWTESCGRCGPESQGGCGGVDVDEAQGPMWSQYLRESWAIAASAITSAAIASTIGMARGTTQLFFYKRTKDGVWQHVARYQLV